MCHFDFGLQQVRKVGTPCLLWLDGCSKPTKEAGLPVGVCLSTMECMVLRVTHFGEPILHRDGDPVTEFDASLRTLAEDMVETMYAMEGVGIAAQQVDLPLRFFVIDMQLPPDEPAFLSRLDGRPIPHALLFPLHCANPEVEPVAPETDTMEEGCLSFPGIRAEITRPLTVRLRYQDLTGARHELLADGWLARAIQHEYDHTRGILFTERMDPRTRRDLETKLKRLKRETRDRLRGAEK